jgi:hypothetical protein
MFHVRPLVASLLAVAALSIPAVASQIDPITLKELESRATHVVLGKVTKVEENRNEDIVTVEVAAFLKGKSEAKSYKFRLVTRGGLKDFDPAVKVGASGVFFLKEQEGTENATKAYWGSIATFPKDHFK